MSKFCKIQVLPAFVEIWHPILEIFLIFLLRYFRSMKYLYFKPKIYKNVMLWYSNIFYDFENVTTPTPPHFCSFFESKFFALSFELHIEVNFIGTFLLWAFENFRKNRNYEKNFEKKNFFLKTVTNSKVGGSRILNVL